MIPFFLARVKLLWSKENRLLHDPLASDLITAIGKKLLVNQIWGYVLPLSVAAGKENRPPGVDIGCMPMSKFHKIFWLLLLFACFQTGNLFAYNYGDRVQCTVNLNVRATASTSGTLLTTEASGSKGTIESGTSQSANGYTWWYITWDNGYTGWSVDSLQLITSIPPTPTSPNPGSTSSPGPVQSSSTVTLSWVHPAERPITIWAWWTLPPGVLWSIPPLLRRVTPRH